ncbi:MAG: nuclear transport factor 2 family protein [Chitinophagales bacterium]
MTAVKKCLAIIFAVIFSFSAHAQTKTIMIKETVHTFRDAINAHDISRIAALLTNDHVFVDATGNEVKGKEKMTSGWDGYFKLFPDYHIEITEVFILGDTAAAFGFAEGSYKGIKENHWRLPASWKAVVHEQKIKLWQVYADTKLPFDIMAKNNSGDNTNPLPRVTGVGGLFFKCKDPNNLKNWYKQHLHLDTNPYGTKFEWRQGDDPSKYGCTQWSPFGEKTTYFAPSTKDFMINYRVNNLEKLVEKLRNDGVTILDAIEDSDFGKFVHILDCEQNKVELWEPKDAEYNTIVGGRTK